MKRIIRQRVNGRHVGYGGERTPTRGVPTIYAMVSRQQDMGVNGRPQGASLLYTLYASYIFYIVGTPLVGVRCEESGHSSSLNRIGLCGRPLVCTFLVFFIIFSGAFFLLPQRAVALGETTLVQIHGPFEPPGFSPALLTTHVYDTVIFVNQSTTAYAIASTDGSFSSPAIPAGQQWRVTFSSLGAHEYHATEAPQRMVGEILVVADSVSLLPTPIPQVEATAVAIIAAGKHPPDIIVLPVTPTPTIKHTVHIAAITTFLSPLFLLIGGGIFLLCVLVLLGILLLRRRAKRAREEDEMETLVEEIVAKPVPQKPQLAEVAEVVAQPSKKRRLLLAGFHWKRAHDDEMDDDDDEE